MNTLNLDKKETIALCVSVLTSDNVGVSESQYAISHLTSKKQSDQWLVSVMKKLSKINGIKKHIGNDGNFVDNVYWLSQAIYEEFYQIYRNDKEIRQAVDLICG